MHCEETMNNATHLQGIGNVVAKPAGEFKVGDLTCWNYGYTYEVVATEPKGKKSCALTLRNVETGEEWVRVCRLNRLIAVGE